MTTPTPEHILATATALLQGTGLRIQQRRHELIITNPADPEKGQVCISLQDGYITWERTQTSYWGHLNGIPTTDPDAPIVPASQIIQALTGQNNGV